MKPTIFSFKIEDETS